MQTILNKNLFLIKEHVGMFKAANNFDIFDPETNQHILNCREPNLGFFTKIFRFSKYKRNTPFNIEITTLSGEKIVTMKRGTTIFRSDVEVFDEKEKLIGLFKQKFWSFGGKFEVTDENGKPVCVLQGKWTGWDFKLTQDNKELAHVSKKWNGLGKELFTSADNYILEIYNTVPQDHKDRKLILAAVLCIDMVLKE